MAPGVAFCGEENDPNYNIMKISKDPTKHSIVQRGKVAARQLVEGIAIEEVRGGRHEMHVEPGVGTAGLGQDHI